MIPLILRGYLLYKSQPDYEIATNSLKLNQKVKLDLEVNFEIL